MKTVQQKLNEYSEYITESGCQIWLRSVNRQGYGNIWHNGKSQLAHRISWETHNNKIIPQGKLILHQCDIPSCINPHHLKVGTHMDNYQDMIKKNRYTIEQIIMLQYEEIITSKEFDVLYDKYLQHHVT